MGFWTYLARPDVRRHRYALVTRRLRFEIKHRVLRRSIAAEIIPFDDDLRIAVHPTNAVERAIYLYGYHEFAIAQLFCRLIAPGMTVVDAGAHVGQYTLLAAKRVGPTGLVLAIEPNPDNLRRLNANIHLNGFMNVRVFPQALSDRIEHASLYLSPGPEAAPTGSLVPHGGEDRRIAVETITLDALTLPQLHVVKMDVEGAEPSVLRGAARTIEAHRPAILFEVFSDPAQAESSRSSSETVEFLRNLGYRIYGLTSWSGGVSEVSAGTDLLHYREAWNALNLLAIHSTAPTPS